ncbi:MAG: SoxR reducing system RseC family protein [Gammaproteobacteria bacterium]|nr:SoxR reducing system RseC family protein [Gammaproteobacteria bacterium]
MIEEHATVINNEGNYVWVSTQRQSSCGHCAVKNSCGTSVLAKVLGRKSSTIRCLNTLDSIKKGDKVIIALDESALLIGSFLIYFLPLLSMIFFAGIAVFLAKLYYPLNVDFLAIIASFIGLFCGFFLAQKISKHNTSDIQFEPKVIKKITEYEHPLQAVSLS